MGQILRAECTCGYKSGDLDVGCGMVDFNRYSVPVACPACHSIRVMELHSGSRTCRKCKTALYALHEEGNFSPADVLTRFKVPFPWDLDCTEKEDVGPFPNIHYRCPHCGKMEMKLEQYGCWD